MVAGSERPPVQIGTILATLVGGRSEDFALRPIGAAGVFGTPRMRSHVPSVTGWFQGIVIRPGLSLVLNDIKHVQDHTYRTECADNLKFHFRLSGQSSVGSGAAEERVSAGLIGYLTQPAFSEKYEKVGAESHERSITLVCARDFLMPILQGDRGEMPRGIADFVGGRNPDFAFGAVPLPLHLRQLVETLLRAEDDGDLSGLGALMMEARALELLCAAVRHLTEQSGASDDVSLRDRRRIDELRVIVAEEGEQSHSLAQLCRMLGWNETQMIESFRKVTGTTISTYRHQLRMDEALRKLRTTDQSITNVAFDAGYTHSGNFATAFRRTFGFSPREARTGRTSPHEARLSAN